MYRKVYVITTTKRPVPLQHFLYTGRWGGSRHNKFLLLDAEKWINEGWAINYIIDIFRNWFLGT